MSSGRISSELRGRIREQAGDRCGYCRSLQKYVLGRLKIEYIISTVSGRKKKCQSYSGN